MIWHFRFCLSHVGKVVKLPYHFEQIKAYGMMGRPANCIFIPFTTTHELACSHGCQMAISRFLDCMCLAFRASGLWLR